MEIEVQLYILTIGVIGFFLGFFGGYILARLPK